MRLTVKERILLHLFAVEKFGKGLEVPKAVTQEGIAEAVWIRRRHLSRNIRPMMEEDLVIEERAHVRGIRQRRKVYRLTALGKLKAGTLQEKVMETTVRLQDESGMRNLSVAQVLSRAGGSAALLEVVRLAMRGEPVRLGELEPPEPSPFVAVLGDAPEVKDFVGRRKELEAITGDSDGGARLFVVRGVAGIGKSSLAAEVCTRLRGERHLFWHRVRPWDTRDSILSRLGAFLAAQGKPGLQAVLMRGDTDRAPDVFREDLAGTQSFLVFDDAHEADAAVLSFFRLLVETLQEGRDARAVVLTRTVLSFYNRRDVVLRGIVEELELQGLESHEVAAYLSEHQMPKPSYEVAAQLAGHPLFLELLRAHNPFSGALVDVRRYLEEEVYRDLTDSARGMMKVASLYSVPVPREALFEDEQWPHEVFLSLLDRSLLRPVGDERFEVHDTIRDFFTSLVTPAESARLTLFAAAQLRGLAFDAQESEDLALCSSYLSNAVQLSKTPTEQASLWEALGDVSQRIGDLQTVTTAYREAADLAADSEAVARAHRKMAFAFIDWGDVESAEAEIGEGFESLGEARSVERGWLHLGRSHIDVETINASNGREEAEAALSIFEEFGDVRAQVEALIYLAFILHFFGIWEGGLTAARSLLITASDLSVALEDQVLIARVGIGMITVSQLTGDLDEASKHFAATQALTKAMENPMTRAEFLDARAWFHIYHRVDHEAAVADVTEMTRIAREVRSDFFVAISRFRFGDIALVQGKVGEARRSYGEAAGGFRQVGNMRYYGLTLFHVGWCCLMQGDVEGFRKILPVIENPEMKESKFWWVYPKMMRVMDLLLRGDRDRSQVLFEEILQRLEAFSSEGYASRFELPRDLIIYGVMLRAIGEGRKADEYVRRGREIYKAAHMAWLLDAADAVESRLEEGVRSIIEAT